MSSFGFKLYIGTFILASLHILAINAARNRLIRVDGINPTCYQKPHCKSLQIIGAVLSVDKSLPYMAGVTDCCFLFDFLNDDTFFSLDAEYQPMFMAKVLNSTVLEGEDSITFYEGEFGKMVKNITASDPTIYEPIFFETPLITVDLNKDKSFRSIYEIVITVYHKTDSPMCVNNTSYYQCSPKSVCIDQDLLCDKFPHCPYDNDEEPNFCSTYGESDISYDKLTIAIVFGIFLCFLLTVTIFLLIVCFCRNKNILSSAFLSIFGDQNSPKEKSVIILHDEDQTVPLNEQV